MGLLKAIPPTATAELVTAELQEETIPVFRSRRASAHARTVEQEAAVEELAESEPSGVLFDAFVDRLAQIRKTNGKIA
mgnify:CR=1 FL=1